MAKTKKIRLICSDAAKNLRLTLTREQIIGAVGNASHDLECVLSSIAALADDVRAAASPCQNKDGVDLPTAILALCEFGQRANNEMFVTVCDPVEAARLEASHG